jgi:hypothetical protein
LHNARLWAWLEHRHAKALPWRRVCLRQVNARPGPQVYAGASQP